VRTGRGSTVKERGGATHYSYGEGSLTIHMVRVLISRACLRILKVEHLKVRVYLLGWGVSQSSLLTHPLLSLTVEHLKVLISRAPKGPYGRAPKGPYQSSLLTHPFRRDSTLDACLWKTTAT